MPGPFDTDDEGKSAVATRAHPCFGVPDDDRALGTHTESVGSHQKVLGLQKDSQAGVSRDPEPFGGGPVDADIEQVVNPGNFQHLLTAGAR